VGREPLCLAKLSLSLKTGQGALAVPRRRLTRSDRAGFSPLSKLTSGSHGQSAACGGNPTLTTMSSVARRHTDFSIYQRPPASSGTLSHLAFSRVCDALGCSRKLGLTAAGEACFPFVSQIWGNLDELGWAAWARELCRIWRDESLVLLIHNSPGDEAYYHDIVGLGDESLVDCRHVSLSQLMLFNCDCREALLSAISRSVKLSCLVDRDSISVSSRDCLLFTTGSFRLP
jgi:hypothetical protein